jgi:hypothetical protein
MPSLTELLTKAGVTIPDGVNIVELAESSDEIKGLATAKNDLHQWKLENKPLLDSLQAKQAELEAAAAKALEEKEKLAIQNKDYETLAQLNADKLKKLEEGLNASRERTQKAALEAAQTSLASLMNDPIYGKYYAEKSVLVELNEIGEPVTKFKFGEQVFDKLDDWKSVAVKDETIASKITVGGQSQSPAATGQTGGQGGQQPQQPKLSSATQGYMANLKP